MKITKQALRQIIKEEMEAVIDEGAITNPEQQSAKAQQFLKRINTLLQKVDYDNYRSPDQMADIMRLFASEAGMEQLGKPSEPTPENKFSVTDRAYMELQDFMRDGDPKEVLTTIYKIYAIMMRNKDKIKDYAKQRSSKEYAAFVKHRRAQK